MADYGLLGCTPPASIDIDLRNEPPAEELYFTDAFPQHNLDDRPAVTACPTPQGGHTLRIEVHNLTAHFSINRHVPGLDTLMHGMRRDSATTCHSLAR